VTQTPGTPDPGASRKMNRRRKFQQAEQDLVSTTVREEPSAGIPEVPRGMQNGRKTCSNQTETQAGSDERNPEKTSRQQRVQRKKLRDECRAAGNR